ncbi:sensor histidine kinase [Geothermobacter hydrogeniphilus]|uniref:histidine kinase n=1 Tax=Geothermobacter hydrogeniphilus TaxID=1969733 RepID=A0A1X0XT09_9BACT|nr:ATP-binding protein [Geothermobacter hydrogeniphilus]ORJ56045.1 hypothetical protein B5V00_14415 [Geothermobacter hydrogeniphilus]
MTLKSKIILQTSLLCLILWVGACYLFLGTYRVQQKLRYFTPATDYLIAVADIDLALSSEQRFLWSSLAGGGTLPGKTLDRRQQRVIAAFERALVVIERQRALGVVGEDDDLARVRSLFELYNLWRQRSRELLKADSYVRRLTETARVLLGDQLFPGLEEAAEDGVGEVQEAYVDLEETLGFFPWMQAGARQRIRDINADLAFVIDGNHVYALLNRQFAVLQAYRVNGQKEDLGRFQELFALTEDALSRWQGQSLERLRLDIDDRARSLDLDKVKAVEEGYSLLRELVGEALLPVPVEKADEALKSVVHRIEGLIQGNLRPAVMASLKSGVESIHQTSTVTNQVGVAAFAVLLLLIIVQSLRWVRDLLRSLDRLRVGIAAFQSGDLDHRVEVVGRDEFTELARSLNLMAEQLQSSRQEIGDLNASLERKVRERTRMLEEANRELKAFNYMVSHDLRNPLSAVLGLGQVLLEKARRNRDEDQIPLQHVVEGAERIDKTIDALLNLSQFGCRPLRYDAVDLAVLAGKVRDELQLIHGGFMLNCPSSGGLTIAADPDLMRLVMENLMQNALKYAVADRELRIEVGRTETEKGPAFYVRDNGRGFDPSAAGDIFAPFSRLHEESGIEGKGIGLAIVQRIIRRHGGDVWAEGMPGEGACFYFTIGLPRTGES